jgi:hypothetical protein
VRVKVTVCYRPFFQPEMKITVLLMGRKMA